MTGPLAVIIAWVASAGLYGAPTVWAANFSEAKQKEAQTIKENTNPYLMIMKI